MLQRQPLRCPHRVAPVNTYRCSLPPTMTLLPTTWRRFRDPRSSDAKLPSTFLPHHLRDPLTYGVKSYLQQLL